MADEMIERVARALAECHGDKWDDIPEHKAHWIERRGEFGGRFRDINERWRSDYLSEAQAAIAAMQNPSCSCGCHTMNQMAWHQRGCPYWRAEPWPC